MTVPNFAKRLAATTLLLSALILSILDPVVAAFAVAGLFIGPGIRKSRTSIHKLRARQPWRVKGIITGSALLLLVGTALLISRTQRGIENNSGPTEEPWYITVEYMGRPHGERYTGSMEDASCDVCICRKP